MGTADNKRNARRLIDAVNQGELTVVDEVVSQDFVDHTLPPGTPAGREGYKAVLTVLRQAFPDLRYTIEDELAEGDRVAQRVTGSGTMKAEFQGLPATGKHATWQEMHLSRFDAAGRMVEHWGTTDELAMLTQLELMPLLAARGRGPGLE
jgi:predicted ester cyclase